MANRSRVEIIGEADDTGTTITFKPDGSIFTETVYQYEILQNRLRELAYLNKGITITFTDYREKDEEGRPRQEIFHSDEGVKEFGAVPQP